MKQVTSSRSASQARVQIFDPAQMFDRWCKPKKCKPGRARRQDRDDAFLEQVKKSQLISRAGRFGDLVKRNRKSAAVLA